MKSGSSDSATFMRKVPEPDLIPVKRRCSSGSMVPSGTRSRNSSLGPTLAATARASIRSPDCRRTPVVLAAFDDQAGDRGIGADAHAARLGGARHGLGDGAHAAHRMTPYAGLAVHLAEAMVQQHVGGAGRVRAGVRADDTVEGEGALHHVALEPEPQVVGGTLGEQVEQQPLVLERQSEQRPAETGAAEQLEDAAAGVGRPPQHQLAQQRCRPLQRRVIGRQPLRIARREGGDRLLPVGQAVGHQQVAPRRRRARSWPPAARRW